MAEKIGELEVAVRVQAFDSALFVEEDKDLVFMINLSGGDISYEFGFSYSKIT